MEFIKNVKLSRLFLPVLVFVFVLLTATACSNEISVLNEAQKKEFEEIFSKLDVNSSKEVVRQDENDKGNKKAYTIRVTDGEDLKMYMLGNKIVSVMLDDRYLYADGKYSGKYSDFVLTTSDKVDYQIVSEQLITKILKSPSSADFPSLIDWKIWKDKTDTVVQAYVDAENSFGASLRSEFQIIYKKDKSIKSLIFDGEEYIK